MSFTTGEQGTTWSDEEIVLLRELFPQQEIELVTLEQLLGRSRASIFAKARYLKLVRRKPKLKSEEEIEAFARAYQDKTISVGDLMQTFGLSKTMLYDHARRMRLLPLRGNFWTDEEIEFLQQCFAGESVSPQTMCDRLNRRWDAIRIKAYSLNLRCPYPNDAQVKRDFFRVISEPAQAYWLGFIGADGCVKQGEGEYRLILA